jgi:hypothetical protein
MFSHPAMNVTIATAIVGVLTAVVFICVTYLLRRHPLGQEVTKPSTLFVCSASNSVFSDWQNALLNVFAILGGVLGSTSMIFGVRAHGDLLRSGLADRCSLLVAQRLRSCARL